MKRYPGIKPFTSKQESLFYGRNQDIFDLNALIDVNNLVVLYGRSGFGKSSLINAGLIPDIEKVSKFKTLSVRFGAYNDYSQQELIDILKEKLLSGIEGDSNIIFSDFSIPGDEVSTWRLMKSLSWKYRKKKRGILVVLDQFEEVFTYPSEQVKSFEKCISELLINHMNPRFYEEYIKRSKNDPEFLSKHAEEIDYLENSLPVKVLIGIRSDKLSLLDRFSRSIPTILKNNYELKPLGWEQAKEAIIEPARNQNKTIKFDSPTFNYTDDAIYEVLDFLSKYGTQSIESFLLQIICQRIENQIVSKSSYEDAPLVVDTPDLGDLEQVISGYYHDIVSDTNQANLTEAERLFTRYFVESILIDKSQNNRISLDKTLVYQFGIGDKILKKLVDIRLIREEPNTVSGISYEISHDTLIAPILQSKIELGDLDQNIETFFIDSLSDSELNFILKKFISIDKRPKSYLPERISKDWKVILDLEERNIIRDKSTLSKSHDEAYELLPIYQDSLVKISTKLDKEAFDRERKRKTLITYMGVAILALAILIISISYSQTLSKNQEIKSKSDSLALQQEELIRMVNQISSFDEQVIFLEDSLEKASLIVERGEDSLKTLRQQELADKSRYSKLIEKERQERENLKLLYETIKKENSKRLEELSSIETNKKLDEKAATLLERAEVLLSSNPTIALRILENVLNNYDGNTKAARLLYDLIGSPENLFFSRNLIGHTDKITDIAISDNGAYLVSSGYGKSDNRLIKWNLNSGEISFSSKALTPRWNSRFKHTLTRVAISKDGSRMAAGTSRGKLYSWIGDMLQEQTINGVISGIEFSSDNFLTASINSNVSKSNKGEIVLLNHDKTSGNLKVTDRLPTSSGVKLLLNYPNDKTPVLVMFDHNVRLMTKEGQLITPPFKACSSQLLDFSFSAKDNLIIGSCANKGEAIYWYLGRDSEPKIFYGTGNARSVEYIEGNIFAIGNDLGHVKMFNYESEEVQYELKGHGGAITDIEVSSDKRYLFTASEDKTIKAWQLKPSKARARIINSKTSQISLNTDIIRDIRDFLSTSNIYRLRPSDLTTYNIQSLITINN